jgi:hypothetical protein
MRLATIGLLLLRAHSTRASHSGERMYLSCGGPYVGQPDQEKVSKFLKA